MSSEHANSPFSIVFLSFSSDGRTISAIEFFKLCKLCKIYPTVITFEDLKKIVLKNRDFWLLHQKYESFGSAQQRVGTDGSIELPEPSPDNSFPFEEFVNAFRVSKKPTVFFNPIFPLLLDCRPNRLRPDR